MDNYYFRVNIALNIFENDLKYYITHDFGRRWIMTLVSTRIFYFASMPLIIALILSWSMLNMKHDNSSVIIYFVLPKMESYVGHIFMIIY